MGSVSHFVEAIAKGTEPILTGMQGLKVQKFAAAAHHSADIGREILLDEFGIG